MKSSLIHLFLICGLVALAGCGTPIIKTHHDPKLEFGHALLVGNEPEEKGYGLYSYLLFGSSPTDANGNLYLSAISACVEKIPNVRQLEKAGFHREELNVTYILIYGPEPATTEGMPPSEILARFNYARARLLLARLPGSHANISIISTFKPLSSNGSLSEGYLRQNLSSIPPDRSDLIRAWILEFLERASRPEHWNERTMNRFILRLRTAIANAAESLPEVGRALMSWIVWVKHAGSQ